MLSDFYLVKVACVTKSYVGVPMGDKGQVVLVHRSQVLGTPGVGDWVKVSGRGFEMKLRPP